MSLRPSSIDDRIIKRPAELLPAPNLLDYEATCNAFTWAQAATWLDGLPGGAGLNIAHEAVDRHLLHGRAAKTAIRWIGKTGERRELSYAELPGPPTGSPMRSPAWACSRESACSS
jgi:acetyl-CoA synthetase